MDATLAVVPELHGLGARIPLLAFAVLLNGAATGLYISTRFGPGPRDGLMTGLHLRTGRPVRLVRTLIEVAVLAAGLLLGGSVGVGTVVYALAIGPLAQFFLRRFAIEGLSGPAVARGGPWSESAHGARDTSRVIRKPGIRHPYLDHPAPLPFAHRGGAADGLENTAAAFRRAVDRGYRYLETDVHATSDGKLVAFHDATLDRVTDSRGEIRALPWRAVRRARVAGREPLPLFEDLLEEFPPARWNVDLKAEAALRAPARPAAPYRRLGPRVRRLVLRGPGRPGAAAGGPADGDLARHGRRGGPAHAVLRARGAAAGPAAGRGGAAQRRVRTGPRAAFRHPRRRPAVPARRARARHAGPCLDGQ